VPASKFVVQAKAHSIYEDLSKIDDNVKHLSASTGWFSRFLKRYNFHNIKMTREPASPNTVAVSLYGTPRKFAVLSRNSVLCDFDLHDFFRKVPLE
jgi:hypothetical protein